MATEKFSIIIDAKDETKRAIDSATRNFKQLQDLGNGGNGVTANGRQTMIRDKSSERFSKDVSVFKDSIKDFGNSIKSAFTKQPLMSQQKTQDLKLGGDRKQLKGDLSKLISSMKKAVKEGIIEGIRDSGGIIGTGRRGGGSGSDGMRGGGGRLNLLGGIAGALKGHLVGAFLAAAAIPMIKMGRAYEQNIMQQSQLSGVVRPNFFETPRGFERRFFAQNQREVRQEEQNIRIRRSLNRTRRERESVARANEQATFNRLTQGTSSSLRGINLPGGAMRAYNEASRPLSQRQRDQFTAQQRRGRTGQQIIDRANESYINRLSRYGITSPDLQRMEFARLRAGGAMGARVTGINQAGYIRGTGMDLAEGTAMMSTLARYGVRRGRFTTANIGRVARLGAGAGFGGAMNPEFMRMVTQAVQEGTQAGFSGTPEEIAKNMNIAMNLRDRRGRNVWDRQKLSRESGLSMMRSFQGVMQSTGRLQGGQQQEMMMAALMQHAQQQEGIRGRGAQLNWAMSRLTNAKYTPQVMQIMKRFAGRLEGRGTQGQRLAMMGMGFGNWLQAGAAQQADFQQREREGRTPYGVLDPRSQAVFRKRARQQRVLMARGGVGEMSFKAINFVQEKLIDLGESITKLVQKLTSLAKKAETGATTRSLGSTNFRDQSGHEIRDTQHLHRIPTR